MSEPNLTLLQAACDLGVSLATARRLVRSGRLSAVKVRTGYEERGQWEVTHEAIAQFREAFPNFERPERREPELSELAEGPKLEGPKLGERRELEERTIPITVHMATLEALERADRRFEDRLQLAEELRKRAELAERARMALEYELRSYQLALTENVGSLAEERALRQAAEASAIVVSAVQVQDIQHPPLEDLKTDMPTPKRGWGQRLGRWLLGEKTG